MSDELKYKGRAQGFIILPDDMAYISKRLTDTEFRLWVVLKKHAWTMKTAHGQIRRDCWPGRKRLAIMLGKSIKTIQRAIGELEKKGLLKVNRNGNRKGKPNIYTLVDPPKKWKLETFKILEELKD